MNKIDVDKLVEGEYYCFDTPEGILYVKFHNYLITYDLSKRGEERKYERGTAYFYVYYKIVPEIQEQTEINDDKMLVIDEIIPYEVTEDEFNDWFLMELI